MTWWTHESLDMNERRLVKSRKSDKHTKAWAWTHEWSGNRPKVWAWMHQNWHESLINAQNFRHERARLTHKNLDINAQDFEKTDDCTKFYLHERTDDQVNARKFIQKRTWLTHENLDMNAWKFFRTRKSDESSKIWTWTQGWSGDRTKVWEWAYKNLWQTHESLDKNARKIAKTSKADERTKVWTLTHETHESFVNAQSLVNKKMSGNERTKSPMFARTSEHKRTNVWWAHKSLDSGVFRLRRSEHRHFLSRTVWRYRLPVWDLILDELT